MPSEGSLSECVALLSDCETGPSPRSICLIGAYQEPNLPLLLLPPPPLPPLLRQPRAVIQPSASVPLPPSVSSDLFCYLAV